MAAVPLASYAIYLALAFGLRTVMQFRSLRRQRLSRHRRRRRVARVDRGRLFALALIMGSPHRSSLSQAP